MQSSCLASGLGTSFLSTAIVVAGKKAIAFRRDDLSLSLTVEMRQQDDCKKRILKLLNLEDISAERLRD